MCAVLTYPLCIAPLCQTPSAVVIFFLLAARLCELRSSGIKLSLEVELCISPCCIFATWLHRCSSFIFLRRGSRRLTLSLWALLRPVISQDWRKGCSESYTSASQVHLKMRSDDTRASSESLAPCTLWTFLNWWWWRETAHLLPEVGMIDKSCHVLSKNVPSVLGDKHHSRSTLLW